MQTALITGASSGIGRELAYVMAKAGHNLVLVARNKQALKDVQAEIEKTTSVSVRVVTADLSKPGAAQALYEQVKADDIGILVNNAGVGLKGDFFHDDHDATVAMAQLNMVSLMELTQLFGRDFITQNSGRILNIASVTAFIPGPKQPVYYATKAFVRSLSRALAYDLRHTKVTVTALHPGITKTGFFSAAGATSVTSGASPRDVAELGYRALMHGTIEVTYGLSNKLLTGVFARVWPARWQAAVIDRAADA
ncbi:MAG TPA: SDR family oxidoreductase [Candidatus Saccharimonadales bacterium]|nr:SDR family oxidoreductase [Candidatus Saccharimonadales bacterium]